MRDNPKNIASIIFQLIGIVFSSVRDVKGRGYQAGSKVGDGYGQDSIWSKESGVPVWVSLLIVIFVIGVLIVSCCCYRRCRQQHNEWIGLKEVINSNKQDKT